MDWTNVYLNTLITQIPAILNNNNNVFKRYLDVFYSETEGIIISPVTTSGRIKGATGEFVTVTVDNLIVKKQYTNLYESVTTADYQYYTAYINPPVVTRAPDPSAFLPDPSVWPTEDPSYRYIDVTKPYYKIFSDASIALSNNNLSQVVEILFETSVGFLSPYVVKLDPSYNMIISVDDASTSIQLICVGYDASYGPTWIIKEFSGANYPTLKLIA